MNTPENILELLEEERGKYIEDIANKMSKAYDNLSDFLEAIEKEKDKPLDELKRNIIIDIIINGYGIIVKKII